MIVRDPSLFRTLRHVPPELRALAYATVEGIAADYPSLPAPGDEPFRVPLAGPRWRRRVGASTWWVIYSWSPEAATLVLRTVNELP